MAVMTARFAPRTLTVLADLLLARRASLGQRVEALRIEVADALSRRDLSDLFDHEDPSVDADATTALTLVDRAEWRLWNIDEAIARIVDGTYGYCIECGGGIPLERLRALPATARCVGCSRLCRTFLHRDDSRSDKTRSRPLVGVGTTVRGDGR